jgi:alkaline phosphatase D
LVTLPGAAEGSWTVEGVLGFDVPRLENNAWVFRAPTVVVETPVTFTHSSGAMASMTIAAASHPPSLADGMALECGPFAYGVASGDPASDGVWLWTRVDPKMAGEVGWEVASDPAFSDVVAAGSTLADAGSDFTVNVRAEGLQPATTYYYRFAVGDASAQSDSITGRTRTAPSGEADRLRFAVTSCTSIFSGYFNGYRAIARRLDLDGLIHVGDYLYDFPDEDELIRIPDPVPEDPETLEGWRALHAYHLSDPDLRAARAAHPWVMLWDNHDVNSGSAVEGGGVQAFREWNPVSPPPEGEGPEVIYRRLPFGDLVDILVIDVLLFRDDPDAPDTPEKTILGETQSAWFHETIAASSATWKLVGNQKPVAVINGLLTVLGGSTWNGFPDARAQMFGQLAADQVDNALFLSGDAHITAVTDLVAAPDDPKAYDPKTGQGAVAVEFQPASMSRGNVDEFFPTQPALPKAIEADSAMNNPHYRFLDLTRHGYGVLDIDAERIQAEVWYLDILERTDEEEQGASLEVRSTENHWAR